jgi:hypothetical protein
VGGLEAVEPVQREQRALDDPGDGAVALRSGPGERLGAELLGPRRGGGRGDARLLGVELLLLAEAGDDDAAAVAARGLLVRDADSLQGSLRLAGVHKPLQGGIRERAAVEEAADPRVGVCFLGFPKADCDLDRRHGGAV